MKTLNEQIQRLRDVLHTCYESIARKGGTLPPVGERNMTNLPDAVESVPNSIADLVATENGKEYLPADYGVYGFGKVKTELPKVKVSTLKVSANCINEDGRWGGEQMIDTSECTTLADLFFSNQAIKSIDASGWDTSKVTSLSNTFHDCKNLGTIDVTGWDVSSVTNFNQVFYANNNNLTRTIIGYEDWNVTNANIINSTFGGGFSVNMGVVDFRKWEIPNATKFSSFFPTYNLIKSLIGGETIESVIANNTTILKGLKIGYNTGNRFYTEDRASLRALINGLADLTGQTSQTLTLNKGKMVGQTTSSFDTLTEEDIAIAVAKNWTITSVG